MINRKNVLIIFTGVILFLGGAYAAILSHSFYIFPGLKVTNWRNVLVFSLISCAGLIVVVYSFIKLKRKNRSLQKTDNS